MAIERVVFYQMLQGQVIQNSFLIGQEDFFNNVDRQAAIEGIHAAYENHLSPVFVNQWRLFKVTRQNVSADGFPAIEVPLPEIVGAGTGDAMANQVAGIVHFRGESAAPNKSTKFLSGWVSSAMTNGGIWESGALSAMDEWATDVRAAAGITSNYPLLVGRFYPNTSEVHVANLISFHRVSLIPGVRKSRRIGVGS